MKILFVCLGNICRSPIAEGILRYKSDTNGYDFEVDSSGTSNYHIGEPPDSRAISIAAINKVDISNLRARQFTVKDFDYFDLIVAMDKSNYYNILGLARNSQDSKKVKLFMNLAYPGKNVEVPDPYYDGKFKEVFDLIDDAINKIIIEIKE